MHRFWKKKKNGETKEKNPKKLKNPHKTPKNPKQPQKTTKKNKKPERTQGTLLSSQTVHVLTFKKILKIYEIKSTETLYGKCDFSSNTGPI